MAQRPAPAGSDCLGASTIPRAGVVPSLPPGSGPARLAGGAPARLLRLRPACARWRARVALWRAWTRRRIASVWTASRVCRLCACTGESLDAAYGRSRGHRRITLARGRPHAGSGIGAFNAKVRSSQEEHVMTGKSSGVRFDPAPRARSRRPSEISGVHSCALSRPCRTYGARR